VTPRGPFQPLPFCDSVIYVHIYIYIYTPPPWGAQGLSLPGVLLPRRSVAAAVLEQQVRDAERSSSDATSHSRTCCCEGRAARSRAAQRGKDGHVLQKKTSAPLATGKHAQAPDGSRNRDMLEANHVPASPPSGPLSGGGSDTARVHCKIAKV